MEVSVSNFRNNSSHFFLSFLSSSFSPPSRLLQIMDERVPCLVYTLQLQQDLPKHDHPFRPRLIDTLQSGGCMRNTHTGVASPLHASGWSGVPCATHASACDYSACNRERSTVLLMRLMRSRLFKPLVQNRMEHIHDRLNYLLIDSLPLSLSFFLLSNFDRIERARKRAKQHTQTCLEITNDNNERYNSDKKYSVVFHPHIILLETEQHFKMKTRAQELCQIRVSK